MPLACAFASTACATSLSFWYGSVVLMTNCSGRPCEPGSDGNWKAATRAPAMLFHFCCSSCCSWVALLRPLAPGLEQHAAEALVGRRHAGDLEHLVVLGNALGDLEHLLRVDIHLLRGRIRRADDLRQHDALVLLRRELRLRRHEQVDDAAEQDHAHHDRHRPGVERAVQHAAGSRGAGARTGGR